MCVSIRWCQLDRPTGGCGDASACDGVSSAQRGRNDKTVTISRASLSVTVSLGPRQRGFVIWNAPAPRAAHSKADTRFQRNICCYGTEQALPATSRRGRNTPKSSHAGRPPARPRWARSRHRSSVRASIFAVGSEYVVRRQRSPYSLQRELTYWLDLNGILDSHQHPRTNQDLPGLCNLWTFCN